MHVDNGKVFSHCTWWRSATNYKVEGYFSVYRLYNNLTFITYKDCIMYNNGSLVGVMIPAGTIYKGNGNATSALGKTFVFN